MPSNLSLRNTFNDLAVGDVLGGDGRPEILITQPPVGGLPSQVAILRYQGNGTFVDTLIDVGIEPSGIVVANLNGDGLQDFAVTCALSDSVYVFYQTQSGLCMEVMSPSLGSDSNIPAGIVAGRFLAGDRGPAPMDLATVQSFEPATCPPGCRPQSTRLTTEGPGPNCPWNFKGTGPYDLHQEPGIWGVDAGFILNGNTSALALEYGEYHTNLLHGDPCAHPRSARHLGLAAFTADSLTIVQLFDVNSEQFFTNGEIYGATVGSLTEDRYEDVVVAAGVPCDGRLSFVTVRPSTGSSLGTYTDFLGVGPWIYDVDIADINHDGLADVLVTTPGSDLVVATTDGNGHFVEICRQSILGTTLSSAVADFDGDEDPEIATMVTQGPFNEQAAADIWTLSERR